MPRSSAGFRVILIAVLTAAVGVGQSYKKSAAIAIGGNGGWDYLAADSANRMLYVSHGGDVEVIDLDTAKPLGKVPGTGRIHGIATADELGTGFISDGANNQVVAFDLKTLQVKETIKAGTNPDGIVYDSPSKRVFAFNGRSQDATVIHAETGKVEGTIALGGKPEFPVSDGAGNVYDNIEDKNEIVRIDAKSLKVTAHWSIACESPSGLALDKKNRRLFAVCDGKKMAVVDADSGRVVATPEIGEGPDAAAFDPGTGLAFSSNGQDGTVTVIQEVDKDHYKVLETVATAKGARTMTLDTKTHKLYLSAAEMGAAPAPSAQNAHPRATVRPGTFHVLVLSR